MSFEGGGSVLCRRNALGGEFVGWNGEDEFVGSSLETLRVDNFRETAEAAVASALAFSDFEGDPAWLISELILFRLPTALTLEL